MALRIINLKNKILCNTKNIVINSLRKSTRINECANKNRSRKSSPVVKNISEVTRLDNGIRIATQDIGHPVCTIGLFIETGSRWESENFNGIAHFHEHMILKGIPDLDKKLKTIGTRLKSYTTREMAGFYATCLPSLVPSMVEIFADIVKCKTFDESIINSERETTLYEMKNNDSNYKKVVFDYLHSTAFQGTPLGQSTVGTTKNVKKFTDKDITKYITNNYKASRMVISVVGLVCHKELCDVVQEFFSKIESSKSFLDPCRFTGSEIRFRDDSIPSVYAAIAIETCSKDEPDYFPLTVAASIIGSYNLGQPTSIHSPSNLTRACAEDSLCDQFQAFHNSYSDTGLWGVYFQGDPAEAWDMVYNIQTEWMKLCIMVTSSEVERGKNRLKTYMARKMAGTDNLCIDMGKQLMYSINILEIGEIFRRIDDVTQSQVQTACMNYIYDQCPAVAAVGSTDAFPEYNRLRSGMFWLRF